MSKNHRKAKRLRKKARVRCFGLSARSRVTGIGFDTEPVSSKVDRALHLYNKFVFRELRLGGLKAKAERELNKLKNHESI